jgi:internalin A
MINIKEIALSRIRECVSLKLISLSLDNLNISEIPSEILEIKNLKYLTLRGNRLPDIPALVFKIKTLERLDISHNKIHVIPDEIGQLNNLFILKANDNAIERMSESICNCIFLTTIYLSKNKLKKIPESLIKLKDLKVIELSNNPYLSSPPLEIATSNVGAIFNYLSMLLTNKRSVDNYEAKLIIVGEGNVGKTCLKERIIKGIYNDRTNTTHGIEISKWHTEINKIKDFIVNIWDFGGQEIYHATHQYFLTRRSVYLFVWNARTDDDIHIFDKWLNTINSLSNSAPVIIVQSKIDERFKNINTELLTTQFPNIVGFFNVSSSTGEGFDSLIFSIKQSLLKLEHIGSKLPSIWVEIRQRLESLGKKYLTFDDYLCICQEYNLTKDNVVYLSDYFHDIGVFLHFKDNPILRQVVFIDPSWATNSVYSLIDNSQVIDSFGEYDYSTLETTWLNYPKTFYPTLIELMLKFELSYKYEGEDKYIIPSLLPENPPDKIEWRYSKNLQFVFKYKHSTSNIISRFIVKAYDLIQDKKVWKFGTILSYKNSEAFIRYNPFDKEIIINTSGEEQRSLLEFIRREFDKIHKSLHISPTENIPCICIKCKNSSSIFMWDFDFVTKAHSRQIQEVLCQKNFENVSVNELLLGITNEHINFEKEIFEILLDLRNKYAEDEKFIKQANNIISLKPNFFGLGIDFNELIKRFITRK